MSLGTYLYVIWKINSGLWTGLDCEKKGLGRLWASFEVHFLSFHGQYINSKFFEIIVGSALKRIKVNKSKKKLGRIFYGGKTSFFRAKNLSVNTWRHLFSYLWRRPLVSLIIRLFNRILVNVPYSCLSAAFCQKNSVKKELRCRNLEAATY